MSSTSERSLRSRLLHATAEVLLSFALAAGGFLAFFEILCNASNACDNMGGIAFVLAAMVLATTLWSGFIALVVKFRDRYRARVTLDAVAGIATAACWINYMAA